MKRLQLFLLFMLVPLTAIAILLTTVYIVSFPTTGLQLAERARQAQINTDQAQVAKDLSAASLAEAQARATERQSVTDTFQALLSSVITGLGCLVGLAVVGVGAWWAVRMAKNWNSL